MNASKPLVRVSPGTSKAGGENCKETRHEARNKVPNKAWVGLLTALPVTTLLAADLPDLPEAFDAGWQGQKPCEILYEVESVRIGRCVFPPGVGHEKHFHYPHFGYVAEGGTVRIKDGTGAVEVRNTSAGSTWSTSEITIHEALNVGETTTSYIIVEPKPKPEP